MMYQISFFTFACTSLALAEQTLMSWAAESSSLRQAEKAEVQEDWISYPYEFCYIIFVKNTKEEVLNGLLYMYVYFNHYFCLMSIIKNSF